MEFHIITLIPSSAIKEIQYQMRSYYFLLLVLVVSSTTIAMSAKAAATTKQYDLIIYGATGFTGKLAAQYVASKYPDIKYALAGRSRSKLESVRDSLVGENTGSIPLIVADAKDPDAIDSLVASTSVVANYAGTPFLDKALPVVEACTRHGTCYTDITGEVPLQRVSYDRYHKAAVESKAIIIHQTGYDSIPSDVGAFLAADAMKKRHDCDCKAIRMVVGKSKGGLSGGTLYTGLNMMLGKKDEMPGIEDVKARGSYSLDPEGATGGPDTRDGSASLVDYDEVMGTHVAPFIMAACNAPVVRKSNALFGYRYGKNCSYSEVTAVKSWFAGAGGVLGFGLFGMLIMFPPTRWALLRWVLPKPGEGPSKELQDTGFFENKIYAVGDKKGDPVTVASFNSGTAGDPGYKATAQMSIEASLCMALEREKCSAEGGVLTPATALGMCLVDRLNASGMKVGVEE